MKTDDRVPDGQRLTGEQRLQLCRDSRQDDVGAQPANIHTQSAHRAIGGDEQVEDVEACGCGVCDQSRVRTSPSANGLGSLG